MISIRSVSKKYGDFLAVDDLSLEIPDGQIFGLLGPNGAGKSTTLKMMAGIIPITKGDIFLDRYSIRENPLAAKATMGYIADTPDMFLGMKGMDYLAFVCSLFKIPEEEGKKRMASLSESFHMKDALNDYIANYSHGMRQKIFVMGALIHNPDNWILDEPLTGLDPEAVFEMKEMMQAHAKEGKCVLFSTHVLDVAEKVCDHIGIISKGKLLFSGTLGELQAKEKEEHSSLEQLFLELVK